jgi:hypothetical protein
MAQKPTATDRRTARYEKLCTTIERTQRRFEKYDRLAKRALKSLATLERQRTRLRKAMAKATTAAADDLIGSTVPQPEARVETTPAKPEPAVPVISTDDPDLVQKVQAALDAGRPDDRPTAAPGYRLTGRWFQPDAPTPPPTPTPTPAPASEDDGLELPGFLDQRDKAKAAPTPTPPATSEMTGEEKDALARAEITAERAAKEKTKRERRATKKEIDGEVRAADLTGQRRRMPLQGKDALAAIAATNAPKTREAHMESMGFRRVTRKR